MKKSANVAVALIGIMLAMPVVAQEAEADAVEPELEATTESVGEEAVADEAAAESEVSEAAPAEEFVEEAPAEEAPADELSAEAAPADDAAAAEEMAVEEAPAEETASGEAGTETGSEEMAAEEVPAEEVVAEEAPVDETVAADSYSESSSEESYSEEGSSEETASEDDGEPLYLYAGVDMAEVRASFSDDALVAKFGGDKLNSSFYRLRVGTRLFEAIGIEAHYGLPDQDDSGQRNFETGEYYGVFVVPTGVFLDVVEISAPVGYTLTKVERGGASEKFDAVSFGMNIEVPITLNSEWLPDIRIGGGGTVYQAKNDARLYGYHFGIRLDFKL